MRSFVEIWETRNCYSSCCVPLLRFWYGPAVGKAFQRMGCLRVYIAREVGFMVFFVAAHLILGQHGSNSESFHGTASRWLRPLCDLNMGSTTSPQRCCSLIVSAAAVCAQPCCYDDSTTRDVCQSPACTICSWLANVQPTAKHHHPRLVFWICSNTGNAASVSHVGAASVRRWHEERSRGVVQEFYTSSRRNGQGGCDFADTESVTVGDLNKVRRV